MAAPRKLTLNREQLAELGDADLAGVAGASLTPCPLVPSWYAGVVTCLLPALSDRLCS